MAADSTKVRDVESQTPVPILTDVVTTVDGVAPADPGTQAQITTAAFGAAGAARQVSEEHPLPVGDKSPPLTSLGKGGVDVLTTSTQVAAAAVDRTKVDLCNAGPDRVWIGVGEVAVVDEGVYLDEGDVMSEWTAEAVNAICASGDTARVTRQEWA